MDHLNANGIVGKALKSECKRWREQAKTVEEVLDKSRRFKYRISRNNYTDCINGATHFVVRVSIEMSKFFNFATEG